MPNSILSELKATLPCRSTQLDLLYGFFQHPNEPFPPTIFINGGPSVGKSILTTTLLAKLKIHHAIVDLIECYTPKLLYETILRKLLALTVKCDNMMDFLQYFDRSTVPRENLVLVIDKCEQFLHMDANLFPTFAKLAELLPAASISVIFLSKLVLQKYYPKVGVLEPVQVRLRQYKQPELLAILALDLPLAAAYGRRSGVPVDAAFHRQYLAVFLTVFYRNCRDFGELRYNARLHFAAYVAPVARGEVDAGDQLALWRRVAPVLKQALQGLYLRVEQQELMETVQQTVELPFYAKFLLIAAYLASYNNAKDDKRIFMKAHGKRRKTANDVKAKNLVEERLNTKLGPKVFSFDRLLAIFYSILEKKVGFNNNLLVQVSTLVELQLVSSLSDEETLDEPKFKCNVDFEFIQDVAKMVGFNIRKYLSDFCHI